MDYNMEEEVCYHTVFVSDTFLNGWTGGELDPPASSCLNAIPEGSGYNERIGSRVANYNIRVAGVIERGAATALDAVKASSVVTLALVLDTQTNGTQLSAEDVYLDTAPAVAAFRNLENSHRFKVLRKETFRVNSGPVTNDAAASTITHGGMRIPFDWNIPLDFTTKYGTGADTVANIKDNSLHLIGCSTSSTFSDALDYGSRLTYVS